MKRLLALALFCAPGCSALVDSALNARPPALDGSVSMDSSNAGPCASFPDGTACTVQGIAADLVCIDGRCQLSTCGDGARDPRSEACDDGNTVSGDGCEPGTCEPSCDGPEDCDNSEACDGVERCEAGACTRGTPADNGSACQEGGTCRDSTCVPFGCGDGVVILPEQCEPPESTGCQANCTWQCEADGDCDDENLCDGINTCDEPTHTCAPGPAPTCVDDGNPCTIESCDATMGCVVDVMTFDQDTDGHFQKECGGDDCDDANPNIHPGLGDFCGDGWDNDCSGTADDTAPTWYVDCDFDGYAAREGETVTNCVIPSGPPRACGGDGQWIARPPTAEEFDCDDRNASARPLQPAFFSTPYGGSRFDYDCDGRDELDHPLDREVDPSCTLLRSRCYGETYYTTRPACGDPAQRSECRLTSSKLGTLTCARGEVTATVACH